LEVCSRFESIWKIGNSYPDHWAQTRPKTNTGRPARKWLPRPMAWASSATACPPYSLAARCRPGVVRRTWGTQERAPMAAAARLVSPPTVRAGINRVTRRIWAVRLHLTASRRGGGHGSRLGSPKWLRREATMGWLLTGQRRRR
jgi:hypothetical protein